MQAKRAKNPVKREFFFFTFAARFSCFCNCFKPVRRVFQGESITLLEVNVVRTEAVIRRCSKKLQYSQENTCVEVSF